MNRTKNIVVICEGASEWAYLQRLNSFLASLPFPDGWLDVPVRFIGRPPKVGVGTGAYKPVERALRKEMKENQTAEKWVWVDADLYIRNEKDSGDNYRRRPANIAPFYFSILNFEDFLACHLDDESFKRWITVMSATGHFTNPLCWDDYKIPYAQILPGYHKGGLPADIITLESLGNLKRHIAHIPTIKCNGLPIERTFAELMLNEICRWYTLPE